jgi:hypothetical protein
MGIHASILPQKPAEPLVNASLHVAGVAGVVLTFALPGFLNRSDTVKKVKPCLCTISPWFNWFSSIHRGARSAWRAAKNRLMPDAEFMRHALILPDFAA